MKFVWTFLMVVVVIVSAWTFLAAQPAPVAPPVLTAPAASVPRDQSGSGLRSGKDFSSDANALRRRYRNVTWSFGERKKARLMTDEQLQQAIDAMNAQELEEDAGAGSSRGQQITPTFCSK